MPTRILLFLSGFLLLFILGAGGFYLYTQNKTRPGSLDEGPRDFSLARSLAPTPMPEQVGGGVITAPISTEKTQAFLNSLTETDGDFLSYSYVNNIYVGKVKEVSQIPEEFNGVTYAGHIVIINNTDKVFTIRFSQTELENMEIIGVTTSENVDYIIEDLDFASISTGDNIQISETINLLDPNLNRDKIGVEIKR